MPGTIYLENVSRKFLLQHHKARSLQDALVNFAHRRNGTKEEFWALKDVNLEVRPGETLGIIGQNGSGKSTILKLITRILEPTSGRILVDGKVSALIELGAGFHPDLTGRENIFLNGAILGISKREMSRRFDEIVAFSELERFIDTPVKHFSSGMYMRLGFSVAINVDPDILIIDEVLSVGDEAFQRKCMERIGDFRRKGKTILFVSHSLGSVETLCDRVVWLDGGVIRGQGPAVQTIRRYLEALQRHDQELREPNHQKQGIIKADVAVLEATPIWTRPVPDVVEVKLTSKDGRESYTLRTGDDVIVCLDYRVVDPDLRHTVDIAIRRSDGLLIHQCSYSEADPKTVAPGGVRRLEIEFPELPLLAGTYDVVASVRADNPESSAPRLEERSCRFSVWCDRDMAGLVVLPHRRHLGILQSASAMVKIGSGVAAGGDGSGGTRVRLPGRDVPRDEGTRAELCSRISAARDTIGGSDPVRSVVIRARAPLRISFAGGGTDVSPYPEERGGAVLSATINKHAYVSLRPRDTGEITVHSLDYDIVAKYHVDGELLYDGELDLVKAAIRHMGAKQGFDLFLHSDAPPGSGLGSSSTVIVTLIGSLARTLRRPMTTYEVAQLAYHVEREDLGIKGGKQDQYAATFGGFNFIEFLGSSVVVNPLRIPTELVNELEYRLLLCYTGKTRLSARILERQIDRFVEKNPRVVEALDATKETAIALKNALLQGRLDDFGDLLHAGWELKKRFDSAITTPQIDEMYTAARQNGAIGGKILGAGGGGYLLLFCEFDRKHLVARKLEDMGGQVVEFGFETQGLQTWEA